MNWKTTSTKINYDLGPNVYVWGSLHPDMLALANQATIRGSWLNLAAGDGRYNELLMDKCTSIIAFDLDQAALDRLVERAPVSQRGKLQPALGDLTHPLPFDDNELDGCLCTGILHLFNEDVLRSIFKEILRVLKPQATLIFDFAVDIRRECTDGTLYNIEDEPKYSIEDGRRILRSVFRGIPHTLRQGAVPDFRVTNHDREYVFRCNVLTVLVKDLPALGDPQRATNVTAKSPG